MRTNIEIDEELLTQALKTTGLKTKQEAVELGLRTLLRLDKQRNVRRFRGRLSWDADWKESR